MKINYQEKDFKTRYAQLQEKFINSGKGDIEDKRNKEYCLPFISAAAVVEKIETRSLFFLRILEDFPKDFFEYVTYSSLLARNSEQGQYVQENLQTLFNNLAYRIYSDYNVYLSDYVQETDESCRQELYGMMSKESFRTFNPEVQNSFLIRLAYNGDPDDKEKEFCSERYKAKVDFLLGTEEKEGFFNRTTRPEANQLVFDFITPDMDMDQLEKKFEYLEEKKSLLHSLTSNESIRIILDDYTKVAGGPEKVKKDVQQLRQSLKK